MKTELIKAEEQTERKYPYLAITGLGSKAIFIAPHKGIWLEGGEWDDNFTSVSEHRFTPLPKGSKIILIQE